MLLVFIPIFPDAFKLSPALLLVPVILAILAVLLVGVALMVTSVLNVIYRDVAYLVIDGADAALLADADHLSGRVHRRRGRTRTCSSASTT